MSLLYLQMSSSRCRFAHLLTSGWLLLAACCFLMSFHTAVEGNDKTSMTSIIKSRGFDADEYEVISQNYVIKVYRIMNPLADKYRLNKIPVLAAHGIIWDTANMFASSKYARPRRPRFDERVILHEMQNGTDDRGLHFLLANNNYDVWMYDARGTTDEIHGRISNMGNDKSFWDFSLDEQALFDLPLVIDFILYNTGARKVNFIGFSQSTTFMYMLLSMRPEYHEKVASFFAIAPVAYTNHVEGAVWPLSQMRTMMPSSIPLPVYPAVLSRFGNFFLTNLCTLDFMRDNFCRMIYRFWAGTEDKGSILEGTLIDSALKTTSVKAIEQYIQNSMAKDFRMYDYKDDLLNMEMYGQNVPPFYNLSNIRLKTMVLFRGTNDNLSDPKDQMILLTKLKVKPYEDHILPGYSHIDFIISPTVLLDVNEPLLRDLDKINGRQVRESHSLYPDAANGASEAYNPQLAKAQVQVQVGDNNQTSASGGSASLASPSTSSSSSSSTSSSSSSSSLSSAFPSSSSSSTLAPKLDSSPEAASAQVNGSQVVAPEASSSSSLT